ncbi:hypothetical protein [Crossiella equi]|uniref:hypothetical protein n=1 Tax=Crossiella equi TaxID=130796 RepID=UPI000A378C45|nr:hypothetical protein [Crossiella equi]
MLAMQRFTARGDQVLAEVVLGDERTASPMLSLATGAVNERLPVHRAVPVTLHGLAEPGERVSVALGCDRLPACVARRPQRNQPRLVELNPGSPPARPVDGWAWEAALAVPVIGSHGRTVVLGDPVTGGPYAAAVLDGVPARQLVAAEAVLVGYDPARYDGVAEALAEGAAALHLRAWPRPLALRPHHLRLRRRPVTT